MYTDKFFKELNFIDEDENITEDVINSIVRLHLDLELYFKINTLNGV